MPIANNTTKTYDALLNQNQASSDNKLSPVIGKTSTSNEQVPSPSPEDPRTPPQQLKVMQ